MNPRKYGSSRLRSSYGSIVHGDVGGQGRVSPRRRNMQANRRRDTGPELALRSLLHAKGFRYRTDLRLELSGAKVRPDIVFTRWKVAVFVDGCFWHQCPLHGTNPKTNSSYWGPKLERNRQRDERNTAELVAHGWTVIRIWEHDEPLVGLEAVAAAIDEKRGR